MVGIMLKSRVAISALMAGGFCMSIHAKTIFQCPKEVEVKQVLTELKKNDSWAGVESIALHKHKRTFFQQRNDLGELREDDEVKVGDEIVYRWMLGELADVYLLCAYVGTSFIFEQKIPSKIKYCEITIEEKRGVSLEKEVVCY